MMQNIIVFVIIGITLAYACYAVYKSMLSPKQATRSNCGGCKGCELKNATSCDTSKK